MTENNEIEEESEEIQPTEELEDIGFYDNLFSQLMEDLHHNNPDTINEQNIQIEDDPNKKKKVLIENICDVSDEEIKVENIKKSSQNIINAKSKNDKIGIFNDIKNNGNINTSLNNNTMNISKNERKYDIKKLNDQIIQKFGK